MKIDVLSTEIVPEMHSLFFIAYYGIFLYKLLIIKIIYREIYLKLPIKYAKNK